MANAPEFDFNSVTVGPTDSTPYISLNVEKATIEVKGVSIPENTMKFYESFNNWILKYCQNPQPITTVTLGMIYLNSSSSVILTGMIKALNKVVGNGNQVIINWLYEEGDEEMKDLGEMYEEDSPCAFNIIQVPVIE